MLGDSKISPLYPIFPNLLFVFDSSIVAGLVLIVACVLATALALGWWTRVAAVCLWFIWATLFSRNPLIANPGLPMVGWLLLFIALLPPAPYGSLDATRGDTNRSFAWKISPQMFFVLWAVMALAYSFSGLTKIWDPDFGGFAGGSPSWMNGDALSHVLNNPLARPWMLRDFVLAAPASVLALATWGVLALELLFAPLAILKRARPYLWCAMLAFHVGLLLLIDFADLTVGVLMFHLFALDPDWFGSREMKQPALLFYDGDCGLCHGAVRFLLHEDRGGTRFRFAPLGSDATSSSVSGLDTAELADSIIVVTNRGELLQKSRAVIYCLNSLGGLWHVATAPTRLVPRALADGLYDLIAKHRRRWFAKPTDVCPLVPPELRSRFLSGSTGGRRGNS